MSNSIRITADQTRNMPDSVKRDTTEMPPGANQIARDAGSRQPGSRALLKQTEKDPFVAFVSETEENYVVKFRESDPVIVAKGYPSREIFPPATQTPGERVMGMITWMAFGLVPAGVGALVLCPFVLRDAINVALHASSRRERRLAFFAGLASLFLGIIGDIFAVLLILHMLG